MKKNILRLFLMCMLAMLMFVPEFSSETYKAATSYTNAIRAEESGTIEEYLKRNQESKRELEENVLLMHNHPSGNLEPSRDDTMLTDRLLKLCDLIDIPLLDHIIVGGNNLSYFSFKEKELLNFEKNKYKTDYHNIEFPVTVVAESASKKFPKQRGPKI